MFRALLRAISRITLTSFLIKCNIKRNYKGIIIWCVILKYMFKMLSLVNCCDFKFQVL